MYTLNNGNQNPIGNHNYNLITEVETQLLNWFLSISDIVLAK
jgi:hypothetical protein